MSLKQCAALDQMVRQVPLDLGGTCTNNGRSLSR